MGAAGVTARLDRAAARVCEFLAPLARPDDRAAFAEVAQRLRPDGAAPAADGDLAVGVLQVATRILKPTPGVVPRLVAVVGAPAVAGPWIGLRALRLAGECLALAARAGP